VNHRDDAVKTETEIYNRGSSAVSTEAEPELKQIYLHPGDIYASPQPTNLSIIVGSCVAVCVFNPCLSIGGATHYLLPTSQEQGKPSPRYGDVAIKQLLHELRQAGSRNKDLQAEVYGGACVLTAFHGGSVELIGDKNVRFALEVLSRESIPVVKQETGGEKGRKITMRTNTGAISCKLIGS